MKLHSASVILVLSVIGLASMVSGWCLTRNTVRSKVYFYHCFMSSNYMADVETAPTDIPKITFSNAKIKVVRNRSFSRLSKSLELIQINFCETREIEDNAFEGLVKLNSLDMAENNLQVVKGVWFKGLPNLKTVSFRNNDIKQIENSFYATVPPLETLDISGNELNCFPLPSTATFKTKMLRFRYNPLSWGCVIALMEWVEETGIDYDDFGRGNWDASSELVWECEERLGKHFNYLTEQEMKQCAERTAAELLPPPGNYTVNEVCQFLKNKPSPFLTCL